jgi:small-conductance mechanosensitive channel
MPLLLHICQAHPKVLAQPAPSVVLSSMGGDGLEFTVTYWFDDAVLGPVNLKSDINLAIWKALQAHGIPLPRPVRMVPLGNP